MSGVRQKAEEQADETISVAASSLEDFTAAIRKASDELGERDQSMAANLLRQAATGLEDASAAIQGKSLSEITHSLTHFARRQPAAFLIGAALAGVALGRFARASSDHSDAEHLRRSPSGSASLRSRETSIPSNGVNRSEPAGSPLTRAGSSALAASRNNERSSANADALFTPVSPNRMAPAAGSSGSSVPGTTPSTSGDGAGKEILDGR